LPESILERENQRQCPAGDTAWRHWTPALLWLGVIAIESTKLLSSENTGSFLYTILIRVFGTIDIDTFDVWHHYLRKTGHVVGYGMLSWLLFRAWRATLPVLSGERWVLRWAAISFLMTALVASLDEWHQAFIPSRTGTPWDIVLDSCAALAVQAILYIMLKRRSHQM